MSPQPSKAERLARRRALRAAAEAIEEYAAVHGDDGTNGYVYAKLVRDLANTDDTCTDTLDAVKAVHEQWRDRPEDSSTALWAALDEALTDPTL